MKRIVLIILLLAMTISAVSSCAKRDFEWDATIKDLEDEGFKVIKTSENEDDLKDATDSFNSEIKFDGGDFTVKILKYANLNKTTNDNYYSCQFIEFETEEQAKKYFNHYIDARLENNKFKVRHFENIIILTNSNEAMEIVGGSFR